MYTVYFVYLYNCILLLIFYRAHGCLGAAPVSLGPPPQGSWGASRGGGGALKSADRSLLSPLGFRIEIYDDFYIDVGSF